MDRYKKLLSQDVPNVKLGNTNSTGKCGMCGEKHKQLYPRKVGQVKFMICINCKTIMDM